MSTIPHVDTLYYACGARVSLDRGAIRGVAKPGSVDTENSKYLPGANVNPHPAVTLTRRSPLTQAPLTFVQRWWWKRTEIGDSVADCRVIQMTLRLLGQLNVESLHRSLEALRERHEPLRTRIVTALGTQFQVVDAPDSSNLEFIQLGNASRTSAYEVAKRLAGEFIYQPIDFAVSQMFGARIIQVADNDHVLILAWCHHIVDQISVTVLMRELRAFYAAFTHRREPVLPRSELQFADYAVWQERTSPAWEARHAAYWRTHLVGATPFALPIDSGITGVTPGQTESYSFCLGFDVRSRLCELARSQKTLLPITVLALYAATLLRTCLVKTALLPVMIYGRHLYELKDMIGVFSYCLPLRVELTERTTFCDLLHELTREFAAASARQDYGRLALHARELTMHGAFNWTQRYRMRAAPRGAPQHAGQGEFGNDVTVQRVGLRRQDFRNVVPRDFEFRFEVGFIDVQRAIHGGFGYRSDLFRRCTIQKLASTMKTFVETFLSNPKCVISSARIES
jgi:hypothetical protein